VVRGEHSPYLPASLAERMAAARPGVRLAVIADAGHNVPTDQPTAFGSVVANWLDTTFNSSDT
jgi:esterase